MVENIVEGVVEIAIDEAVKVLGMTEVAIDEAVKGIIIIIPEKTIARTE